MFAVLVLSIQEPRDRLNPMAAVTDQADVFQ
jgi:hypothetical protein